MNIGTKRASITRTTIQRLPELASHDKEVLHSIIDEAFVCHIAFVSGEDVHCIPTAHWRTGDFFYIHGANGSRMIKALSEGAAVSVAITLIDGLVLARAAFNHSMNYRSVVIYGHFEVIQGREEKLVAFDMFMEKIARGRKDEVRPGNAKELAATSLLRLSLDEAAVKVSNTIPSDKAADIDRPIWTGVLPLAIARKPPICADSGSNLIIPDYVQHWTDR